MDQEIADYFKQIYQRPAHMVREPGGLLNIRKSANDSEAEDQVMRDEEEKMVVEETMAG